MVLRRTPHAVYDTLYPVVWSPKYRREVLPGDIQQRVRELCADEEVSQRIRLGSAVEGRDEKGIKKTVCALLKILHPDGPPTAAEFDEYVAYAVEGRRRIKEQMNKRKPDDEFANIQLSYVRADGAEVVVYCPESQQAVATQQPIRKILDDPRRRSPHVQSGRACLRNHRTRQRLQPPSQQWSRTRPRSPTNNTARFSMATPVIVMSLYSALTCKGPES